MPATPFFDWRTGDGVQLRLRPADARDFERLGMDAAATPALLAVRVVCPVDVDAPPLGWGRLTAGDRGQAARLFIHVDAGHRRRGIGGQLLLALIAEARRLQLAEIAFRIADDEAAATALALSCGFDVTTAPGGRMARLDLTTIAEEAALVAQADDRRRALQATQAAQAARSPRAARVTRGVSLPFRDARAPAVSALLCAGLAMAGLLLALLAVWLGTGWLDGLDYRGTDKLARRFLRSLPWALPLAALAGVVLCAYFRSALAERHTGWVGLVGVVRAFALFPLLGFAILGAVLFAFLAAVPLGLYRRFVHHAAADEEDESLMNRLMVVPLWVMTLPFTLLKAESQGDIEIPARVSQVRLLNWLPMLFLLLLVGPGFESESTGERIDPNWLAVIAAYWLADWLIVALYVAPELAAHARACRLAELGR